MQHSFTLLLAAVTASFFSLGSAATAATAGNSNSESGTPIPRNVTIVDPALPIVPGNKLPPPNPASKADQIADLFADLGRTTIFKLVEKVPFEGPTGEPEGIVRLGADRYFVSAGFYTKPTVSFGNGTIINGTDRANGAGQPHLIVFAANGTRIADATLSTLGDPEYHTGGADYDGKHIWATLAQYRPNTTAHFVKIDPRTLDAWTVLHARDHFGGIVHDTKTDLLHTLNWGSRNASTYALPRGHDAKPQEFATPLSVVRNPSYFIDYQDCKFLGRPRRYNGRPVMFCAGVADVGGVAIVDLETMVPLAEIPLKLVSDAGSLITQNPVDVDVVGGALRLYFLPDQNTSVLYVYEAQHQSPFEF